MESGGVLPSLILRKKDNCSIVRDFTGNVDLLKRFRFKSAISVWRTYQKAKKAGTPGPVYAQIK